MSHLFVSFSPYQLQDIQINETVPADDRMFELWYAEPTSERLTFQARNVVAKEAWVKQIREALKSLGEWVSEGVTDWLTHMLDLITLFGLNLDQAKQ